MPRDGSRRAKLAAGANYREMPQHLWVTEIQGIGKLHRYK
jgi:hypothetical protein